MLDHAMKTAAEQSGFHPASASPMALKLGKRRDYAPGGRDVVTVGVSCFYHDAAVCFQSGGRVLFATEEERYSRIKHDRGFPRLALLAGLRWLGLTPGDIDLVIFYEEPVLKLRRLLTQNSARPDVLLDRLARLCAEGLVIEELLASETGYTGPVEYALHHYSHAASAFYLSPFDEALIATIDGVGEYTTLGLFQGRGGEISHIRDVLTYPNSLGLLYSTITSFLGFKPNNDEYKVMGLAGYGKPRYLDRIAGLAGGIESGGLALDMDYFAFERSNEESFSDRLAGYLGRPPRKPETAIAQEDRDLAASLQRFTQDYLTRLLADLCREHGARNLCLAGGVALNCVANTDLYRSVTRNIFVQPASSDAGCSIGAALLGEHFYFGRPRDPRPLYEPYHGEAFTNEQIEAFLEDEFVDYERLSDEELPVLAARLIHEGKVLGWFQGRMEFGPRALGSRSILANPAIPDMQDILNLKVKKRESFRPFAPSVLEERQGEWFREDFLSPYMLFVTDVHEPLRERIPSVTHVDGTARIQSVSERLNPLYHRLITEFEKISGVPIIINTSFNVRGEPIVLTPEDAYSCFLRTDIDCLFLGNYLIRKEG